MPWDFVLYDELGKKYMQWLRYRSDHARNNQPIIQTMPHYLSTSRLKTTRETREQHRLVQAIVGKEIESIELEALSEAAEVEKYQREVVQSVTAKDKKLKEELNQQCPAGRLHSFRYLLGISMYLGTA